MPKYIIILFLLNIYSSTYSQKDSILVINSLKYPVSKGRISGPGTIYNQKTFDKQGRITREMFYLDSIVQITSIVFYFYDNNMLFSREEFNSDNTVKKINRYSYNTLGYLSEELLYEPFNGQIQKKYKVEYSYKDTTLIQKIKYNDKNKWIEQTTIEKDGNLNKETTKYKKGFNEENLKNKLVIQNINGKRLSKTEIIQNYYNGKNDYKKIEYFYDMNPAMLETHTFKDQDNNIIEIIEIRYNKVGVQISKALKNKDGSLLEYYSFDQHNYLRAPINKEMYQLQK
jgi:hypothetical protein